MHTSKDVIVNACICLSILAVEHVQHTHPHTHTCTHTHTRMLTHIMSLSRLSLSRLSLSRLSLSRSFSVCPLRALSLLLLVVRLLSLARSQTYTHSLACAREHAQSINFVQLASLRNSLATTPSHDTPSREERIHAGRNCRIFATQFIHSRHSIC